MSKVANRPLVTLTGGSQSNMRHNHADFRHKVADGFVTQLSKNKIPAVMFLFFLLLFSVFSFILYIVKTTKKTTQKITEKINTRNLSKRPKFARRSVLDVGKHKKATRHVGGFFPNWPIEINFIFMKNKNKF